jgi:predicted nucleic-acid-binding protein
MRNGRHRCKPKAPELGEATSLQGCAQCDPRGMLGACAAAASKTRPDGYRESPRKRRAAVLAIDTNVILRFLVNDDATQAARARTWVSTESVRISRTVLLETEWVLRGAYGFARNAIAAALRDFAGLPNVTLENPAVVAQALDGFDHCMDFADALHLAAASATCSGLASFDHRCACWTSRFRSKRISAPALITHCDRRSAHCEGQQPTHRRRSTTAGNGRAVTC